MFGKCWWGGSGNVSQPQPTCLAIGFKSPAKTSRDHLKGSGNSLTLIYFSK